MSFMELAKARYSTRGFKSDVPVEQEKLDAIIESAVIAPTAANMQPHKIKIFQTTEELAVADQISPCRYGAPLAFLICYDKTNTIKRDPLDAGVIDCSIVTTHMMLEAWDLGLGSVWCLAFDAAKATELLQLPENIVPVAFLPVGYAADEVVPHAFHTTFKPLSDMLL